MDSNADLQRPPKLFREPKSSMIEEEENAQLLNETAQLQKEPEIEREHIPTMEEINRENISLPLFDWILSHVEAMENQDKDNLVIQKSDPPATPLAQKPKCCCTIL